jgi:hypothetical protein
MHYSGRTSIDFRVRIERPVAAKKDQPLRLEDQMLLLFEVRIASVLLPFSWAFGWCGTRARALWLGLGTPGGVPLRERAGRRGDDFGTLSCPSPARAGWAGGGGEQRA